VILDSGIESLRLVVHNSGARPDSPGDTLEHNMADPAAPTTSRPTRSGAKAPRTPAAPSTVSTETENKLARAARSAQRLAELSDVPADDSTLDLFPDDPTRAALEAMNIDVRQGTLTGFELPDEVLAAVEAAAADGGDAVVETPVETKAARRDARAAAHTEDAVRDAGREVLGSQSEPNAAPAAARPESHVDAGDVAVATAANVPNVPNVDAWAPANTKSGSDNAAAQNASAAAASPGTQQMTPAPAASPDARWTTSAGTASPDAKPTATASAARNTTALRQAPEDGSAKAAGKPDTSASAPRTPFGASGITGTTAAAHSTPPRATPELDHARAAAFADTVDALYGVIADQRRAAAEHSRRMKRMLSIVVGVLLVTVAIGVAQMLLLVRLTHDTTVRQQRIEQTLLGQQATLATLLQTESSAAPASVAPSAAVPNAGNGGNASPNPTPDSPSAAASRQSVESHPSAKTARAHKHKPAPATTAAHSH
jgi:hypothetical protein